jgi:hypothetical protein
LTTWLGDTPEVYGDGVLSGKLNGQVLLNRRETLCVKGKARFHCPHLAKIRLLGSLSSLLPTPFFSSVDLNEIHGTFELDNDRLSSENFQIVGPTTRVLGKGSVDISTGEVKGHTYLHFLDEERIKMPIMRQLLRVLHPISNGFEAKLSGTIRDPKWSVWFNPLGFLMPGKRR